MDMFKNTGTNKLENAVSEFNIGNILLEMGKITPEDAERIMRLHTERGLRFGEAAKSLGLITEADIQKVLSRQFDYPYIVAEQDAFNSELIAAYQPFSPQVEVLRAIRSQLMLHWFSAGHKAVTIASVNSGEGASRLIANLAIVFSQLGERTLLVDANLRSPRQHELFNLKDKQGLSEILSGRGNEETISPISAFANLSVLTSGTVPPNPQELVSRDGFKELLESLATKFDVILIDAPSFSACADAQTIALSTGGALLVARQHYTRLSEIGDAVDQLNSNGTRVIGSVLIEF